MFKTNLSSSRKNIITRATSDVNHYLRGIQSKPLLINLDEAKDVPVCINCKYYHPNTNKFVKEARLGQCHKYGEFNVIDGSIIYKHVETAREYFCHGNQYEKKDVNDDSNDVTEYKNFLK